jgi:CMP-N-acetylneuraminic acid synthetase/spore coat polysaccharide biosynthesis predicted glycosyltransferase SpsG
MVLAVIPARGGSKGIPRKNVRLMNGKPLIYYAIHNAKNCSSIDDVVVSSDDEEILKIASSYGVETMTRDSELAKDAVTLDPVIYDAVCTMEKKKGIQYDVVITLQVTSPLLSSDTLDKALESFLASSDDTYISVVNKPHLSWTKKDGCYVPNYEKRLNRQQLPPNYLETGAFLITRRECMEVNSRIGKKVSVYEMPEREAVDIDAASDWVLCEYELKKKRIILRADGYKELGMGHIYHCLTLAYNLTGQEILFVTKEQHEPGLKKLQEANMPVHTIKSDEEFMEFVQEWKPDVVVNDCLNTEADYIKELKKYVKRVVTIEDLGEGADYADVVINALYEDYTRGDNYYWGSNYVCLRDEFFCATPSVFHEQVQNIVVIFGGTDPSNFTKRIYEMAKRIHKDYPEIKFHFALGVGYDQKANQIETDETAGIYVEQNLKHISDLFAKADLAFTSQGRTVYELATMGVPAVVMAQNEREMKHTFAQMNNGFLNLGLGINVADETIETTFRWLVETPQIRKEMQSLMMRHDLKSGIKRVIGLILEDEE